MKNLFITTLLAVICLGCARTKKQEPSYLEKIIFPYQDEHVHGSTIVQLPNGDLLSAWFQGSGERWADDVRIMGSRLVNGDTAWSDVFVMADVGGFPDINPIMFMDHQQRLWLMWYPVLANQWETSIPMYKLSTNYGTPGAPVWTWQDVLFVKAGDPTERGIQPDDSFVREVDEQLAAYEGYLKNELLPSMPDSMHNILMEGWGKYKIKMDSLSRGENMIRAGRISDGDKERSAPLGYPLSRRLGWQTKNKAVFLGERMIVPLYSDGFDCSLFAITDDAGKSWVFSNPVLGGAGIQPTVVMGKDNLLVAYLRDNGPPPHRMQRTESRDKGLTWSIPKDDLLPNPGGGFDAVTMPTGEWVMIFNNSEENRNNLTAAVSDDEGATWKWKRSIENDMRKEKATRSHYPSVIVGNDGRIYVSYSYHRDDIKPGKSVKYTSFTLDWVKEKLD